MLDARGNLYHTINTQHDATRRVWGITESEVYGGSAAYQCDYDSQARIVRSKMARNGAEPHAAAGTARCGTYAPLDEARYQ